MRVVWQSILSIVLGFLGGVIGMHVALRLRSEEWASVISAGTVRATRYELVDSRHSNEAVAFWGQDWANHRMLIAFVDEKGTPRASFGTERSQSADGQSLVYSPFLTFIGSDGGIRLQQRLDSSQFPLLMMGDSQSEDRLLLGRWFHGDVAGAHDDSRDNWSLTFRDPSQGRDYVNVGATTPLNTKERTGYLYLRNTADQRLEMMPR
jgi:hypothetical protein